MKITGDFGEGTCKGNEGRVRFQRDGLFILQDLLSICSMPSSRLGPGNTRISVTQCLPSQSSQLTGETDM